MAVREDLVASAVQFLHDPSVSSSSIENRINFLRTKNLTQEEIDAALTRAGGQGAPAPQAQFNGPSGYPPPSYYQQYPPYAWQAPPQQPKRDWRDWFIMATVVGGASYGLYSLGKRYVYPLVAPPTPERLEQDKKDIQEQFDVAFGLVEQLAKDTEELKEAEKERTETLDTALAELESVMSDLKSANRRREDDASRIRDEVQTLKDAIPKAMDNQKDLTDKRLREINSELSSLKTLIYQRMTSSSSTMSNTSSSHVSSSTANGNSVTPKPATVTGEEKEGENRDAKHAVRSRFALNGGTAGQKASIPAWQLAMSNKTQEAASAGGSSAQEATGSSA